MKNYVHMLCAIAIAGLLAGLLAACSAQGNPADSSQTGGAATPSTTPGHTSTFPQTSENSGTDESGEDESESSGSPSVQSPGSAGLPAAGAGSARREAFATLLRIAHDELTLPDGSPLEGGSMEDVESNLFAVCDVDGDGQEELLLIWANTYTAGMTELAYGYDEATGELFEELREFPGVIFYNNGAAEAPWSHNQGLAGDFWPYNLYQYNPQTGKYEPAGSVDAWDSSLNSNTFPKDIDTDGNGMVYYLLPSNWDGHYNTPVDDAEYVQWRDSFLEGADVLDPSFVPLTAENIALTLDVSRVELADTLPEN